MANEQLKLLVNSVDTVIVPLPDTVPLLVNVANITSPVTFSVLVLGTVTVPVISLPLPPLRVSVLLVGLRDRVPVCVSL